MPDLAQVATIGEVVLKFLAVLLSGIATTFTPFAEYAAMVRTITIATAIINALLSTIQAYYSNSLAAKMDHEEAKKKIKEVADLAKGSNVTILFDPSSTQGQKNLHTMIKIATTALTSFASVLHTIMDGASEQEKKTLQIVSGIMTALATAMGTFSALGSTSAGALHSKAAAMKKERANKNQ